MHVPAELLRALSSRYRIERELGHGGMADVYLAYDIRQKRQVALKVLNRALAVERERFDDEIKTLANLVAPHIVSVFESGIEADSLYYTMEFVDGETLAERIARVGPLPIDDVWRIGREVADALKSAHAKGVIHRDIKPGNILLTADHAWVADFGIAKAITENVPKATPWSTATGVLLGTPLYMSPEQASSGVVLDGRTDIYSLGCVLYEALTGRAPFQGDTPQSVLASHLSDPAPSVKRLRRDVPPGLARIVKKALEKRREDRFASAAVMLEALRVGDVAATPVRDVARWVADHWLHVALGSLAAVGVAVWVMLRSPAPDPSLYALVQFAHRGGDSVPALLNGEHCQRQLYNALAKWKDLRVVDLFQMQDLHLRRARGATTLGTAVDLARAAGAGRLIWGSVSWIGDGLEIRAALYAVGRRGNPRTLAARTVLVDRGLTNLQGQLLELAGALLQGNTQVTETAGGAARTNVIGALWALDSGYAAFLRWDHGRAETLFRRALARDPSYADASLWLGQLMSLRGDSAGAWAEFARAAMHGASGFRWSDSVLSGALLAMAEQRYQDACSGYEQLVARDSSSFWGWLGLGDCRARDSLVVPDPRSRSRWSFRGSYHAAAQAFERALLVNPSVSLAFRGPSFDRLTRLFYIETHRLRAGYALRNNDNDTLWFAAYASLEPDTLGFVPYLREDVVRPVPGALSPTLHAAIEENRNRLRRITASWVQAFPNSPDAHETLARFLETVGDLPEAGARERSSLASNREARRLAPGSVQQLRLAVSEVRLLTKLEDFARAKAIVDSLLEAAPESARGETARFLAGLAVFTGRAQRAIQVSALDASELTVRTRGNVEVPVRPLSLAEATLRLQVHAALGAPAESIAAIERRVGDLIETWVDARQRGVMRDALLDRPRWWAYPVLAPRPLEPGRASSYVQELHWALQRNDVATIQGWFARLRELRTGFRPGEVAVHHTYHEARVLLAIGDTAAATQRLDGTLNALPTLGSDIVRELPQAAGLVRAMVLRAELANRAGDRPTAQRWARAVAILWRDADAGSLQRTAEQMRRLAEAPLQRR